MPEGSTTEDTLELWRVLQSLVTSNEQINCSKKNHLHLDLTKMMTPDYVKLEMRMAELMSQQEASGFRFDMDAAVRVRSELQSEFDQLTRRSQRSTSTCLARSSHPNVQTRRRAM